MSKLRLNLSMSLDGYVAGPNQSVEDPLGIGGMRLHEWVSRWPRGASRMASFKMSKVLARRAASLARRLHSAR